MNLPLQITFRNMAPSEAVERRIWEHIDGLGKFSDRIMGCRVVVEARHHKHHQGNLFHIRIDMTVPGDEIVVSREPALHHTHEDVYVAFRDAFDAVRRRLEDYERRYRRQVKAHDIPPHGRIASLDDADGYGFIETPDGREIYFHRNSVLDADFDRLEVGDLVRFHEEAGEKGPQASTVRVAEKRGGRIEGKEVTMEVREIREMARAMGVRTKGMDKADLVRAIQRAEGNFDCFGSATEEECDQENCMWREDCFAEAIGEYKTA